MSGENVAFLVTSRRLIFASQTMKLIGQYKGVHNIERYTKMPFDEIQRESPQNISIEYTQIRSISVKHGSAQKMVHSGFGGIGGGIKYGDGKLKIDSTAGSYEYTIVASYYSAIKELLAKVGINAD
ncbi:MAG: hypothetical protein NTV30_06935 [Chloroflexi bacterium]|nr:hypothetical protein [Chloroflexota bacterium]